MGPEFFQTMMGHKFFESDVPRIARSLERIADSLDKQQIQTPPVNMVQLNKQITSLILDALSPNGAHHHMCYLDQLATLMGLPKPEEIKEPW